MFKIIIDSNSEVVSNEYIPVNTFSLFTKPKILLPIIIVVFLGILALVLSSNSQRQDVRTKATANTAMLSFSPTSEYILLGVGTNAIDVAVLLNTGEQAVVGTDILINFDQTKLDLITITPSTNALAIFPTFAPTTTTGAFDANKVITEANNTGLIEFGAITFDSATNTIVPSYTGIISPLVTLRFQPKVTTSTSTEIRFKFDGIGATTDTNVVSIPTSGNPVDILAEPTSTVLIGMQDVNSSSPPPIINPPEASPSIDASPFLLPTPTSAATPSTSPASSPSGSGNALLTLKLKFQGISSQKPDRTIAITLTPISGTPITQNVIVSGNTNGIYSNTTAISVPPNTYKIVIDGPTHLSKKVADALNLNNGSITQDFTSQPILTGDAFDNDRVDIFDYNKLVGDFGPRYNSTTGSTADFDFDGDVDIFDYNYLVGNFDKSGDQ